MPDSLNRPKSLAYCASPLRAETAALLHTASAGSSGADWGMIMVELIGIEPTTTCLQGRCSPN